MLIKKVLWQIILMLNLIALLLSYIYIICIYFPIQKKLLLINVEISIHTEFFKKILNKRIDKLNKS